MDWPDGLSDLRETPYYKTIVKYVLRKQLQQLLEEMSSEVGEESLIMTVNPQNGTISHHGSEKGKDFLLNRDDLKKQFLTFCVTSNSQNNQINPAQDTGSCEPGKRKRTTSASPSQTKIQKTATSENSEGQKKTTGQRKTLSGPKSASEILRSHLKAKIAETSRMQRKENEIMSRNSKANEIMSRNSKANEIMSRNSKANQYMSRSSKANEIMSRNSKANEIVSETETTNQILPPVVLSSQPRTEKRILNGHINHQVKEDHTYSMDVSGDVTSQIDWNPCIANYSDKATLTNYYNSVSDNDNQPLVLEDLEIKQEVEPVVENEPVYEKNTINNVDTIEKTVQGNACISNTLHVETTSIQLNGTDIDFTIPELQPIVRLETFNPFEKQVTNNQYRTSVSATNFEENGDQSVIEENSQELTGETNTRLVNSNHIEGLENEEEVSNTLEVITVGKIKEELCSESNSPIKIILKPEVSSLTARATDKDGILDQNDSSNKECDTNQDIKAYRNKETDGVDQSIDFDQPLCSENSLKDSLEVVKKEGDESSDEQKDRRTKDSERKESIPSTTQHPSFLSSTTSFVDDDGDNFDDVCNNTFEDGFNDHIDDSKVREKTEQGNQERLESRNQGNIDSRNSNKTGFTKGTSDDNKGPNIENSQTDFMEDDCTLNDEFTKKENNTKEKGLNESRTELARDKSTRHSGRLCVKKSSTDFVGEDAILKEIDKTVEDIDLDCLSSGSEWKNSDAEDSSSDDDEEILDEDINTEVGAKSTTTNWTETEEDPSHPIVVTPKLKQKSKKFIYDEYGNILGRNVKDEDKVKCVKHSGIYIRKIKKNPNAKHRRNYFHVCIYCKKVVCKMWVHLQRSHKEEAAVKEVLTLKNDLKFVDDASIKSKMEKMITVKQGLIRRQGNHEHNMKVTQGKRGELVVARKGLWSHRVGRRVFNSELFGPCPACLVWMELKVSYAKHKQACIGSSKHTLSDTLVQNMVIQGKILASISKEMQTEVFPVMPNDRLSKTAQSDPLIIALGEYHLPNRHGKVERRGYYANYRMRVAARFLHLFRKEKESDTWSLSDCLKVEHFDLVAKCAINTAGKNSIKEFQHSTFGKRLGYDMFVLISAKIGSLQRTKNTSELEDAKKFHSLLQEKWLCTVQAQLLVIEEEKQAQLKLEEEARRKRLKELKEKENRLSTESTQVLQGSEASTSFQKHNIESKMGKENALIHQGLKSNFASGRQDGEGQLSNKSIVVQGSEAMSSFQRQDREKSLSKEDTLEQQGSEVSSTSQTADVEVFTNSMSGEKSIHSNSLQKQSKENVEACSEQTSANSNEKVAALEKCDPEDFVKLARYLSGELEKKMAPKDITTPEKYRYWVSIALAYLVMFNSCDPEKIHFLRTQTYNRRLKIAGEAHVSSYLGITDLEREVLKTHDLIELKPTGTKRRIESKRLNSIKVPIILPTGMTDLLKHLADAAVRQTCFVDSENNYLFATFDSEQEPLGLQSALDVVRENADLNKPSGITVKNLKKYTSTIFQVNSLNDDRLLQFVTETGLVEKLNLEEGQSISGVKDRLEIAKLIYIQEQGKTEKLRTLQEISFDEIEGEQETQDSFTIYDVRKEEKDVIGYSFPKPVKKKKPQCKDDCCKTYFRWTEEETKSIRKAFRSWIERPEGNSLPSARCLRNYVEENRCRFTVDKLRTKIMNEQNKCQRLMKERL